MCLGDFAKPNGDLRGRIAAMARVLFAMASSLNVVFGVRQFPKVSYRQEGRILGKTTMKPDSYGLPGGKIVQSPGRNGRGPSKQLVCG